MEYDFSRSSERHYRSARLLDEANEMADAAHLYGLAAERVEAMYRLAKVEGCA
jgi:hypothetical protein